MATSALFAAFARLSDELASTASRLERTRRVADYLAALTAEEAELAARLLLGRAGPESEGRRLSLGGRAVVKAAELAGAELERSRWSEVVDFGEMIERAMPPRDGGEPLTLEDVRRGFAEIASASGKGSQALRLHALTALLQRATPNEAKALARIVIGEMRHGVQEGILLEAAAILAGVDAAEMRRAQQSLGDAGALVRRAKTDAAGLRSLGAEIFRAIKPMLAQTAADVDAAMAAFDGRLALEFKLDGARVQIHRRGDEVRIFSRRLQNVTPSLPDVVAEVRRGAASSECILEGEVIPVAGDRPLPFQELMRRFRRVRDIEQAVAEIPVRLYLFDLLYENGRPLLEEPYEARWEALERARGELACVPRRSPVDGEDARAFFRDSLAAGHEGVMAKSFGAAYTPGVRGSAWLKIKHSVTLDLVIVAADWGYGRRHGWLSNYHLAARDEAGGRLEEVGKTFKGPTDAEFRAMTERLLALRQSESGSTVRVRPEIVVEVRFDGIQKSPQYACGMALRFARIVRVRDDKRPEEADTIATLRRLFESSKEG